MTDQRTDIAPLALARALIRCPSVTPADAGALDVVQSALEPLGFTVHRMVCSEPGTADVANLYARLGDDGPNLCFAGHTDVVPTGDEAAWTHPPFAAEVADGVLYGRGAVDMKGAVACFIAAVKRHLDANGGRPRRGSISLLITGDEEGAAINGTRKVLDWLVERGETIDACLVGEPTNPAALGDEIKIGRRGSLTGDLVVQGRQGHVAYPHLAQNPVPALAEMVSRLSAERFDTGNDHFAPTNLEVCVIGSASKATNVIPAEARAGFNVRYNTHWTRDRLKARITELLDDVSARHGVAHEVQFSGTGDVFLTEPGAFTASVKQAVESVTGRPAALTTSGGTSDARFIQAVCPVVEFGLVNATIHAIDERTEIADLETLTEIYTRVLDRVPDAL